MSMDVIPYEFSSSLGRVFLRIKRLKSSTVNWIIPDEVMPDRNDDRRVINEHDVCNRFGNLIITF